MNSRKSAAIFEPAEEDFHRTVAEFLDWALYDQTVYTTFPAGWGKLPPATAGRLHACGLKAGFPDILIFHPPDIIENQRRPLVVGIELKVKNRKPSAAQQLMFPRLRNCGVKIYVCESLDDVIRALRKVGVPLRGRLGWEYENETASDDSTETRSAAELT